MKKSVKIVAASDFHIPNDYPWKALEPYIVGADIVVIAGDFIDRSRQDQISIVHSFLQWCHNGHRKDVAFIVVAGNNDIWSLDNQNPLKNLPENDNVHWLEDFGVMVNGLRFWGTPWIKDKGTNDRFAKSEEALREKFALMNDVDILVSHATPHIEGSYISGSMKDHKGSDSLSAMIVEKKPQIVFCGHVHAGQHEPEKLGDSLVFNVSLYKNGKVSFRPRVIEAVWSEDEGMVFYFSKKDDMKIHHRALKLCDGISCRCSSPAKLNAGAYHLPDPIARTAGGLL